ncbi:twin-arginine translocase TatA/TatE family subunit [Actinomyces gaoshouyii]|uniref:twin-arginine translocase TatA/TatE family subunit n=1 Tax=Actinomyces gaoshouyii TaxID=1960083 RepID=UPI0009B50FB3|nr:twin-arginine translocase TatA/TatE family subunit [Actinomyces gaoshouyii]
MLGFSSSEFVVFLLVAVVVIGPQRLPEYTRKLTQMVRQLRVFLESTKTQIAEEVGPELADLDLSSLDPRQYDPRKIVRDALGEDLDAIKKDLQSPFKAVKDAAKETTDAIDASVKEARDKDRANSLANKIEEKKAEAFAAARAVKEGEASTAELPQVEASQADPAAGAEERDEAESAGEPTPVEPVTADPAAPEPAVVAPTADPMTEPVAVPASLVEDPAAASAAASSAPRPLSPRDIVRAAKEASRSRVAAASAPVD